MGGSLTNYPNGVSSFGIPQIGVKDVLLSGKVFWVDSNGQNGAEASYDRPAATYAAALAKCQDNRGDLILMKEGHAEDVESAAAISHSKIGVTAIGLGNGDDKPTFTFKTATGASFAISGANTRIQNIRGLAGIDGLTNPFSVTGDGCILDLEWTDPSDSVEAQRAIDVTGSDHSKFKLKYNGRAGGNACVNGIRLNGCRNVEIDIDAYGVLTTAWVEMVTANCSDIRVKGSFYTHLITNLSRNVVDTIGGSTWYVDGFDFSSGQSFSGGSAAAVAGDDVAAVSTAVAALQTDVGDPSSRTNLQSIEAMLGNPDSAGATLFDAITGSISPNAHLGAKVSRTPADIFDGTTTALFTVSGGRVLITHIELEVSGAAVDNTTSNTKLTMNPTVGTDRDICANLDVDSDELGSVYSITGVASDALQGGSGGGTVGMTNKGVVAPEGTIDLVSAADAGTGGALVGAEVWYIPLDAGASIAAA